MGKLFDSYWIKSGSISLLTRMAILGFSFVNFLILARILDQALFGVWVLFLTILGFSESIRNAFIYIPLLRYLNSEEGGKENERKIMGASLVLNLALATLTSLVFIIITFTINQFTDAPELPYLLNVSILAVFSFSLMIHINFSEQASFNFVGTAISSSIAKLMLFLFLSYQFIFERPTSLELLMIVFNLGYFLSAVMAFVLSRNKQRIFSITTDISWILKLFHYGKFTFGTNMSSMLNKSSKTWFLGGIVGSTAVAIFAPALRILTLLEIPLIAMARVYYPKIISMIKEDGEAKSKYMYEKSVGLSFFVLLPFVVCIFFFAEKIIWILVGPGFEESVPILQILVFCGLLEPFNKQFGVTLNAIGKANINFYFVIVSSIVGIIIGLVGVIYFGVMGAAWGTLITYLISLAGMQVVLHHLIHVRFINVFRMGLHGISAGFGKIMSLSKAMF